MTTKTTPATDIGADANPNAVPLDQPIQRDGQTISTITLRKPAAGELRGLSLVSVLNMEVETLAALLPRISAPTIHKPEVLAMDPADILAAGLVVAGFLQQKGAAAASPNA